LQFGHFFEFFFFQERLSLSTIWSILVCHSVISVQVMGSWPWLLQRMHMMVMQAHIASFWGREMFLEM
jgi:hypothetical protein